MYSWKISPKFNSGILTGFKVFLRQFYSGAGDIMLVFFSLIIFFSLSIMSLCECE